MLNKISIPKSIIPLIALAFALNILRVIIFDKFSFVYILWNILLAFIPFLISSILLFYSEKNKLNQTLFVIGGIVWLIFLPNAPYIVTDLIHIGVVKGVPVLYDSVLLFTSAWAGLLLGMNSIYHIEKILLSKYSKKITNFIILVVILFASFGIYLGRFLRFNSWDFFTNHSSLLSSVWKIFTQSNNYINVYIYTILFFFFIYMSFISFKYSNIKQ